MLTCSHARAHIHAACPHLSIITGEEHPSARHSVVDWSDARQAAGAGFARADAIDTIVQAGEVLYVPAFWFHFIVSMEYSAQCNSRSGQPERQQGVQDMLNCGFGDVRIKTKQQQQQQ